MTVLAERSARQRSWQLPWNVTLTASPRGFGNLKSSCSWWRMSWRRRESAVSALAQDAVSAIDVALGELSERQRQIGRLKRALQLGRGLTDEVTGIEQKSSQFRRALMK